MGNYSIDDGKSNSFSNNTIDTILVGAIVTEKRPSISAAVATAAVVVV